MLDAKNLTLYVLVLAISGGVWAGSGDGASAAALEAYWASRYAAPLTFDTSSIPLLAADAVAKATPDECYLGLGQPNLYPFDPETENCSPGRLKVNESYVFGLTEAAGKLWFGTAPNMGCLVYGTIAEAGAPTGLTPFESDTWTCEYGDGRYGMEQGLPGRLGDWRPPSIYVYDPVTGNVEEKWTGDPLLDETLGLRSAGALGDLVLLGGPVITGVGGPAETSGINLFAFHSGTRAFLGSVHLPQFNDVRKWLVAGDSLYVGVAVNKTAFPTGDDTPFGAVLRWTGDAADPFRFEIVGWMDGEAAELVEHEDRVFVSTWPDFSKLFSDEYDHAGLWASPPLGADGLQADDAEGWQKVWSAEEYEADEVAARMYNGGALASYQGYLYWGSLHAPLSAGFAHAQFYGLLDPGPLGIPDIGGLIAALFGSHRPINIFRGRDFGTSSEMKEVLYGLETMPAFLENPLPVGPDRVWAIVPNKMGPPRFGQAGFGNCFNTYTWTMAVHDDALYVGSMDWSHILTDVMLPVFLQGLIEPFPDFDLPGATPGGDLFVFPDSDGPAVAVELRGVRNYGNYGVRTMVSTADDLYLGMANAMNLMTDPADDLPEGGWELIRVSDLECDSMGLPGDFDGDGRVRWSDAPAFWGCYTGTCPQGQCPLPLYDDSCCMIGDFDSDGDVDWPDFLAFLWARWF